MRKMWLSALALFCLSYGCTVQKSEDAYEGPASGRQGANGTLPPAPVGGASGTTYGPSGSNTPIPGSTQNQTATCYKGDPFACQVEALIIKKTNAYRGSRGALRADAPLGYVARIWSAAQAQRGDIGHDGFPDQREQVYRQEFAAAATVDISGENVAMSGGYEESAEEVASTFAEMWWNSPGHRENMLGDFSVIGVGLSKGSDGWYATQIFGN